MKDMAEEEKVSKMDVGAIYVDGITIYLFKAYITAKD